MVALVGVFGGSAIADQTVDLAKKKLFNGKNIKNGTITGKKLKNRTLTTSKLSTSAISSLKGQKGDKGDKGATGPAGDAAAFAGIEANGTLFTPSSLQKNFTAANVYKPAATTGVYCIKDLPFTPTSAIASGANGFGANFTLVTVEINGRDGFLFSGECASTDQARVRTVVVPSGGAYSPSALTDEAFYVWFED